MSEDRNLYPHLSGEEARRAIEADQAADAAFDRREEARLDSALTVHRTALHAHWEQRRVSAIIHRDRADDAAERMRIAANQQVENGDFTNFSDTVVPPTREQLAKGGYDPFIPRQPDGTVREIRTYRRRDLSQVQRLVLSGVIDAQGFRDCRWYRDLHEKTGLSGKVGAVDYGREVFVPPHARAMFADAQVEAQETFRFVRQHIDQARLKLLDKVVIDDLPVYRAGRQLGLGWRRQRREFALATEQLGVARRELEKKS